MKETTDPVNLPTEATSDTISALNHTPRSLTNERSSLPISHELQERVRMIALERLGLFCIPVVEREKDLRLAPERERLSAAFEECVATGLDPVEAFRNVREREVPGWSSPMLALDERERLGAFGRGLFRDVRSALERHVYFPEPWEYDLATLYVFECRIADLLPAYFYIFFDGTKGTGKTTVIDHVSRLTDSLRLQSFTLATLSRSMIKCRPVSIDEFDEVERDPEMGGSVSALVRQGYKRDAAPRKICAPKSNEVMELEIAGPKALTFRGAIDDALRDRGFRFPMQPGSSYQMVLLGMAPEFRNLPARLTEWAVRVRAEWSLERASLRIKEASHGEKVRAVLDVLEGNRIAELATVAVLVGEIVGINLTKSLRDAKAAKDRDEGVSRGAEELLDALGLVSGRTQPKLGDAEFYLVSPKEVRAEMDRLRGPRTLPVKNGEFARLRKDARISDSWRVTIRGKDYWKIPTSFVRAFTAGVPAPSPPLAPRPQDVGVPGVDRVPFPSTSRPTLREESDNWTVPATDRVRERAGQPP